LYREYEFPKSKSDELTQKIEMIDFNSEAAVE
jgi:hypothetical protein